MHNYTKTELTNLITGKLRRNFGRDVDEATVPQMFKACAMVLRDIMSAHELETEDRVKDSHARQVHYLSLEFLMGRSLEKNAYNLGLLDTLKQALEGLGDPAAGIAALLEKKLGGRDADRKELQKVSAALARRGYHWSEINEALGRCGAEVELD